MVAVPALDAHREEGAPLFVCGGPVAELHDTLQAALARPSFTPDRRALAPHLSRAVGVMALAGGYACAWALLF